MRDSILNTLGYFALFRHPLTVQEVHAFMSVKATLDEVERCVAEMAAAGSVVIDSGFVQLPGEMLGASRVVRQERALKMIEESALYVKIIALFPFVRAVALSGSVSKLAATKTADFDYFIITSAGRLWIARTLLHIFKKLTFLTGHQHKFCMNYFVDEDHLPLPLPTAYTALELQTLVPVYGHFLIQCLKDQNPWTAQFLPNHSGHPLHSAAEVSLDTGVRTLAEKLFNVFFPATVNTSLMRITDWKWRRKFATLKMSPEEYDRAMMTRPYLSKNHPNDFQRRIEKAMKAGEEAKRLKSEYA